MEESEWVETPKKGKKPQRVGYLKMKVIEISAKKPSIRRYRNASQSNQRCTPMIQLHYVDLKGYVKSHHSEVIPKDKVGEKLPWISYFHQQFQKTTVEQLPQCET